MDPNVLDNINREPVNTVEHPRITGGYGLAFGGRRLTLNGETLHFESKNAARCYTDHRPLTAKPILSWVDPATGAETALVDAESHHDDIHALMVALVRRYDTATVMRMVTVAAAEVNEKAQLSAALKKIEGGDA